MNHKELVNRFTKACYRFEAIQEDLDILLFDTDDEIKLNEYEDLADQAAEIVLKLSANGKNVGMHFYNYYLCRLEYIIAYFRELLVEDKQDELDEEARAYRKFCESLSTSAKVLFAGAPTDCAFPKSPGFRIKRWGFNFTPTGKNEANAAADAPDTKENNGEDDKPAELDNENDTQAAECDEAADDPAASAPISEEDILLPPGVELITGKGCRCWVKLSSKVRTEVRETFGMWEEMNDITGRYNGAGVYAEAVKLLDDAERCFYDVQDFLKQGYPLCLEDNEQGLRKKINRAIDAIPGFRDSEKFKELIEKYPTYKEKEQ